MDGDTASVAAVAATDTLSLKALAGEAYRNPNIYEVAPDGVHAGWNDSLRRERTSAREFVMDWQLSDSLRLSASAYRYSVSDMIEQVVDADSGEFVFANVNSARAHGVELEAEYLAPRGLRVRTSVAEAECARRHRAASEQLTGMAGQAACHRACAWYASARGTGTARHGSAHHGGGSRTAVTAAGQCVTELESTRATLVGKLHRAQCPRQEGLRSNQCRIPV